MLHLWLMERLLWALSLTFGSLGVLILCFVLTGQLSPAHGAHGAILLGAAIAIIFTLSPLKDRRDRSG